MHGSQERDLLWALSTPLSRFTGYNSILNRQVVGVVQRSSTSFLKHAYNRSVEDKALYGRAEHYANLPHVHPKLPRESVCQRQRAKVPSLRPLRC